MSEKLYNQTEALRIAGVSGFAFQNWLKHGLVDTSERTDGGQRRYAPADVVRLAVIASLRTHNMELANAASIARMVTAAPNWAACLEALVSSNPKCLWVLVQRPASKYLDHVSASAYAGSNFGRVQALLSQESDVRLAVYDVGSDVWRAIQAIRG